MRHVNHNGLDGVFGDESSCLVGVGVVGQPVDQVPGALGRRLEVLPQPLIRLPRTEVIEEKIAPSDHIGVLPVLSFCW